MAILQNDPTVEEVVKIDNQFKKFMEQQLKEEKTQEKG
jgi:hypothetical protein